MTNKDKKKWLLEYRKLDQDIERDMEELQRLKSRAEKITSSVSGMPKGGNQGDRLQLAVDRICELEERLNGKIDAAVKRRKEMEAAITTVEDKTLQLLLQYRYIDGMTWEQIAVKMNYDYRWILRLHGRALTRLTIESHIKSMISLN